MYIGCSLTFLGISFVVNSIWMKALFPFVAIYVHFVDILKEEKLLEQEFGSEYEEYRSQVRRYL